MMREALHFGPNAESSLDIILVDICLSIAQTLHLWNSCTDPEAAQM